MSLAQLPKMIDNLYLKVGDVEASRCINLTEECSCITIIFTCNAIEYIFCRMITWKH